MRARTTAFRFRRRRRRRAPDRRLPRRLRLRPCGAVRRCGAALTAALYAVAVALARRLARLAGDLGQRVAVGLLTGRLILHAGPLAAALAARRALGPVVGLVVVAEPVEHPDGADRQPRGPHKIHDGERRPYRRPGGVVQDPALDERAVGPADVDPAGPPEHEERHRQQQHPAHGNQGAPEAFHAQASSGRAGDGRAGQADDRAAPVGRRPDRAPHEQLVEVPAVAAELTRTAALQREPVTFVEGDRPGVVGKGRQHDLGEAGVGGPGERRPQQGGADADAAVRRADRHAELEHVGGGREGQTGAAEVAGDRAADLGDQKEAARVAGALADQVLHVAHADAARRGQQRRVGLGGDRVDQVAHGAGVGRHAPTHDQRAAVGRRCDCLAGERGAPFPGPTSRARARRAPRSRPGPRPGAPPAGGTASSSRSSCRPCGRTSRSRRRRPARRRCRP